jgi:hypothetical protein
MSDVTTFTILNNKFCVVQIGKNWPTSNRKTLTSLQCSQFFWSLFLSFVHLAPCHPLVKTTLLLPQPEALRWLFLLCTGQTWLQRLLKPLMAPLPEPLPEAKPPSFSWQWWQQADSWWLSWNCDMCLENRSTWFTPQNSRMLLTDVSSVALRRAMQMVWRFNNIIWLSFEGNNNSSFTPS